MVENRPPKFSTRVQSQRRHRQIQLTDRGSPTLLAFNAKTAFAIQQLPRKPQVTLESTSLLTTVQQPRAPELMGLRY